MALLSVKNVGASFGGFIALDDVSLQLHEGELLGLIGTNGAGKSTLFSVITGYIPKRSGSIEFAGEGIDNLAVHARVWRGLARTFQVPREFSQLSVFDNMMAAAPGLRGEGLLSLFLSPRQVAREEQQAAERVNDLLTFLNLAKVAREPAGKLSGGQKKLLELGRLLMLEPRCIMLDEPFAGVNPVLIEELSLRIQELNGRGMTVLIIEHNLEELSRIVPRMYVMDSGKVIAEGTPDNVLSQDLVREAYMGGVI
ncbi:ABC transporter ATP-binding protein [Pollutimonas subterranea]|uniref:ABC transporter ATP-binding protein n=1 Tax=Pollutimonas subterranea TaxID=2045210 RepID=A0A2N4U6A3_9BURK|nr:ABC transporter ATP-binding protein [Pollutimonas subterranea]PLC50546.1 ABC transporter ATP-binding protein [Pollutimonas subterranea]